jgi:hypothetical protein
MSGDELSDVLADIASLRTEIAAYNANLSLQIAALRSQLAAARSPPGILAALAPAGNPHDLGLVAVTSSDSDPDPRCTAKNAADFSSDSIFCTDDQPGQWLCVDFKRPVCPTAYHLRSIGAPPGSAHPRGWALEGSADGSAWVEIDRRTDTAVLNGPRLTAVFPVTARPVRFVRITQIQPNHNGSNVFAIAYFDVAASA